MNVATVDLRMNKRWCLAAALALMLSLMPQMGAVSQALSDLDFGGRVERVLLGEESQGKLLPVIVTKNAGSNSTIEAQIRRAGGSIDADLPLVGGFSARVPADLIPVLGANPSVRSITLDRVGKFETLSYDESTVASSSPKSSGATKLWSQGNYGAGVGVAVIDTGISPMNDFTKLTGYRLIHGPDLSGEYSLVDTYGHGTVMAGIIAGDGFDSRGQAGGAYVGMAPESWLVSLKVAGANGATDVSTVLAAMHWVAAYRDLYNIRVVNLSWGTAGTQSYMHDPLNYAVERLWQLGITVVVSAGNSGPGSKTIAKPADDPFVITAGAYNDKQNSDPGDDNMPSWSSRGPTAADGISKPDLVAPGRLITTTRSAGSTIEKDHPKALYAPSYIRGSGTSQAAAATAGAAALLIRQKPHLSPAQVKYLMTKTARPMSGYTANDQGAGRLDVYAAATHADEGYANSTTAPATGLGSLEASRGGVHVQTDCGNDGVFDVIQGEMTAQCQSWDGATWAGATWNGDAWTGATWNGATWNGATWNGATWNGATWNGGTWNGATWNGATWNGGTWNGATWNGATWNGATWNGGTWNGATWNGATWNGATWNTAAWTGATWNGATWNGGTWNGATWNGATWNGGTWNTAAWTSGSYDDLFTSAVYDEPEEWMTVFWGNSPPSGKRIPGERSELVPSARGK